MWPVAVRSKWARCLVANLAVAVLYYLSGKLGAKVAIPPGLATVFWPPSGIALAGTLLFGPWMGLGIFAGSVSVNADILMAAGLQGGVLSPLASTFLIAGGSTAQTLLCAALIRRFIPIERLFEETAQHSRYVLLVLGSCFIGASIGTVSLWLGHSLASSVLVETWFHWWLGDVGGIIILTPLALRTLKLLETGRPKSPPFSLLAIVVATLTIGAFVFRPILQVELGHSARLYLFFLPLLWAALSFTAGEVALVVTLDAALCIYGTLNGSGPFLHDGLAAGLFQLQLFIVVIGITTLTLSTIIAERRKNEAIRADLIAELGRSNRDLERFAALASHDLQAPLRTISLYLELLKRQSKDRLVPDEAQLIEHSIEATRRMSALIQYLLDCAKIGTKRIGFAKVDCESVLDAVLQNVHASLTLSKARISRSPLPSVIGVETQLTSLLQNLIENALKFRSEVGPCIEISFEETAEGGTFIIRDNGIGFDMKYAESIFDAFFRADGSTSGSFGLGLAICKRIVNLHGGKIWAQSTLGKGTAIYFTLPQKDVPTSVPSETGAVG